MSKKTLEAYEEYIVLSDSIDYAVYTQKCSETDIKKHWINPQITNDEKGVAVFIKPTDEFYKQAKEYNQLIKQNSVCRHVRRLLFW